jgi:hypothetical protein
MKLISSLPLIAFLGLTTAKLTIINECPETLSFIAQRSGSLHNITANLTSHTLEDINLGGRGLDVFVGFKNATGHLTDISIFEIQQREANFETYSAGYYMGEYPLEFKPSDPNCRTLHCVDTKSEDCNVTIHSTQVAPNKGLITDSYKIQRCNHEGRGTNYTLTFCPPVSDHSSHNFLA